MRIKIIKILFLKVKSQLNDVRSREIVFIQRCHAIGSEREIVKIVFDLLIHFVTFRKTEIKKSFNLFSSHSSRQIQKERRRYEKFLSIPQEEASSSPPLADL